MRNLETKKEIRRRIKDCRALLSDETRQIFSDQIYNKLVSHPLYQTAKEIYCYVSFGEEVSTNAILAHAWKHGKKVAVPKILDNDTMEFFYIDTREQLKEGFYGILEPVTEKIACGEEVLVVMPGVAFDREGGRIGYGKGYYDGYLHKHPDYHTIALTFEVQCLEQIPTEAHDIRPEWILTEKETYQCKMDCQQTR